MDLSLLEVLSATPCGTLLGECCGVVTKCMKSTSKCTVLLACKSGEVFAVTAFKNTKGAEIWFKDMHQGQVKGCGEA
uniref:CNH domain-containing protein n=1 Tax=Meloidogyne hapla TaxID=6305 RepID=A0A1I8B765_MELHA